MIRADALDSIVPRNWSARLAAATSGRRAHNAWTRYGTVPTIAEAKVIVQAITHGAKRVPDESLRRWAHGEVVAFPVLVRELATQVDANAGAPLGSVWSAVLAAVIRAQGNLRDSFRQ